MECMKCKKTLAKRGSHFVCQGPCQGIFHRGCVRGLAEDIKAGTTRARCNNCIDDGDPEPELLNLKMDQEKALNEILKKVRDIPEVTKQLSTIKDSINLLSHKYDKIVSDQEEIKQKVDKIEKGMINLTNKYIHLEKCNTALEQKLQEIEQSTRKNNIEIAGVEQLPNENTLEIVQKIGKELKLPTEQIQWVRRLPQRRQGKTSSIIVGFRASADSGYSSGADGGTDVTSNNRHRAAWLAQRRSRNALSSDVVTGGLSHSKIYINEDLSKYIRELLWKTKNKLQGKFQFIWIANGRILVKKNEGEQERPIWIRAENDILELCGD